MDPVTIGLIVSAVAGVASKALTPGVAGSSGGSGMFMPEFDNSGFVVNVGRGSATSTNAKQIPTAAQQLGQMAGPANAGIAGLLSSPLVIVGLGVVAYFVMKNK